VEYPLDDWEDEGDLTDIRLEVVSGTAYAVWSHSVPGVSSCMGRGVSYKGELDPVWG
jgi:hypothetical protein